MKWLAEIFPQIAINNLHYLRKICNHNEVDPSSHKTIAENSIKEDKEDTGGAMMGEKCHWVYLDVHQGPKQPYWEKIKIIWSIPCMNPKMKSTGNSQI